MNHLIYAKNTVDATQNKNMKNKLIDVCAESALYIHGSGEVRYIS